MSWRDIAIGVLLIGFGFALWGWLCADDRLADEVKQNNELADVAIAVQRLREADSAKVVELRSHLTVTRAEAARLRGDSSALVRENAELGRELQSAIAGRARLEVEFARTTAELARFQGDTLLLSFRDEVDVFSYTAEVVAPLAAPSSSSMALALKGELEVEANILWENQQPICQLVSSSSLLTLTPSACVVALEDSPIEQEIDKPGFGLHLPVALEIGVATLSCIGLGAIAVEAGAGCAIGYGVSWLIR